MQVGEIVAKIKGDLTDFNKNVKSAKTTAEGFKKSVGTASQKIGDAFKTMTKVTVVTAAAITGVGYALDKVATRGGNIEAVTRGFEKNFGNAEDALVGLRNASLRSISDFDLMLSANKAAMLGVTNDSSQLARLLTVAAGRAQELGIDTTSAFEDIVTGIGRMSPLILDNLGITTGAYKEQMAQLEANGIAMGDAEKKQLLLNTVLADSIEPTETAAVKIAQYKTELLNLKDRAIIAITPKIIEFLTWVKSTVDEVRDNLQPAFAKLKDFFVNELIPRFVKLKDEIVVLWQKLEPLRQAIGNLMATTVLPALVAILLAILDTVTFIIDKTGDLVGFFKDNEEAAIALSLAIGSITAAIIAIKTVALASGALTLLKGAIGSVALAIQGSGGLVAGIGLIGPAVVATTGVGVTAIAGLAIAFDNFQKKLDAFNSETDEVLGRADANLDRLNTQRRAARAGMSVEEFSTLSSKERTAALQAAEGRALGGPVSAGQSYIVGEKRPELFVPEQNGTIVPQVGGANFGDVIINNQMDFAQFKRELSLALRMA